MPDAADMFVGLLCLAFLTTAGTAIAYAVLMLVG
jgi:hypothetical protein